MLTGAPRRVRGLRDGVAVLALAWTAAVCAAFLGSATLGPDTFAGWYNASAYWVSYRDGFVRRGLVGQVVETLLGGPPSLAAASVVGVLMVVLVAAALVVLTRMILAVVRDPRDRLLVAAVVVASPFTFSLAVQNRGRYDAVVVACLALVAVLAVRRSTPWARVLGIALSVLVGAATEEIAFAFLGPPAVVAAARLGRTRTERLVGVVVALAPGLVVTLASLVVRPSRDLLVAASERAAAAGLPVTLTEESSISALGQTTRDGLAFTAGISPVTILVCTVLLGGCFALSAYVLWARTGRAHPRWALLAVVAQGVAALLLSTVGDDYRRWWGLAFVGMVASLVLLTEGAVSVPAPRHTRARPGRPLVVALLLASAALQVFPIWPTWDPAAATTASIEHMRHPEESCRSISTWTRCAPSPGSATSGSLRSRGTGLWTSSSDS